jgi:hypothetical protein
MTPEQIKIYREMQAAKKLALAGNSTPPLAN